MTARNPMPEEANTENPWTILPARLANWKALGSIERRCHNNLREKWSLKILDVNFERPLACALPCTSWFYNSGLDFIDLWYSFRHISTHRHAFIYITTYIPTLTWKMKLKRDIITYHVYTYDHWIVIEMNTQVFGGYCVCWFLVRFLKV